MKVWIWLKDKPQKLSKPQNERENMKRVFLFSILCLATVFTGCFDMSIDMWVKTGNNGRVTFGVSMDQNLAQAEVEKGKTFADAIKEELSKNAKTQFNKFTFIRSDIQEYYADGKYYAAFDADVKGMTSGTEFTLLSNGNYRFDWLFHTKDQALQDDKKWFFIDRYLTIRIHGERILSANGRISDDMKTATWSYPLVDAFSKGFSKPLKADIKPLSM